MQTERRALDYGSRFIEMELREQAMKIVQGWPKMRVNFKALIWIFSQSVGPSLAIWADPVQFSLAGCVGLSRSALAKSSFFYLFNKPDWPADALCAALQTVFEAGLGRAARRGWWPGGVHLARRPGGPWRNHASRRACWPGRGAHIGRYMAAQLSPTSAWAGRRNARPRTRHRRAWWQGWRSSARAPTASGCRWG